MPTSFDSLMRRILLIPAKTLGRLLGFFLTLLIAVLVHVLWSVNSDITAGSTRYLEEISRRLANNMVTSVQGSALVLTTMGSAHAKGNLHPQDVKRVYDRLALENLIFTDSQGVGHNLNGVRYDFSHDFAIMRATWGNDSIFDCNAIHSHDGTTQKVSHMALAVPYYDGDAIRGAVVADVGENWGNDFLNTILMGGNVSFTLFDNMGNLLIKSVDFSRTTDTQYKHLSNINNLLDPEQQQNLESSIHTLKYEPELTYLNFDFYIGKELYRAILVPIREYDVYLLTISTGTVGIQEFISLDRTITITLGALILCLTILCVTLAIFYRHCRTLAFTDPVTDGMSKLRFELEFEKRLHRALPGQYTFFIININKFKLLNDVLGRDEGDRILRLFHENFSKELPDVGTLLCRSGIDEFDLLAGNMSVESTLEVIERAVSATMAELSETNDSWDYTFSVRVGACTIDEIPDDYVSTKDRAKIGMDQADNTYSNNVRYGLFDKEDIQRAHRERSIENCMHQSLANEDFYIVLQPKVVLQTGQTCGAEALIRWHHPQLGNIYPNEFIPLFERNGFINKLDMWVFTKVCMLMQSWMNRGYPLIPVSINLSRVDIERRTDLAAELTKIADSYGVPRELLDLEVTESVFYKDPAFIQNAVDNLRALGFQCSLDDFGSGYSSLNILPNLRVDTLKLDKSFLHSEELNRGTDRVVIKKMVELAHDLDFQVVAEGVETEAQRDFLCQCSCTVGQGYLYSKPVPPEEFERMTFGDKK